MMRTQGAGVRRASFSNPFAGDEPSGDNAQSGVPREVAVSTAPASGSRGLIRLAAVSLLLATGAAVENNTNATSLPNASMPFDPPLVGNVSNATDDDHVVRINVTSANLTNTTAPTVQVHLHNHGEDWTDAPTTNYRAADDEGDMTEDERVKTSLTIAAFAAVCCICFIGANIGDPRRPARQ